MTSTRTFTAALGLVLLLLLSACSTDSGATPVDEADTGGSQPTEVVFEPVGEPGSDPFTESVRIQLVASESPVDDTAGTDGAGADEGDRGTGPGLYGGSGDNSLCDIDQLVDSLMEQADKAEAWADAAGIEVDEIPDHIGSLEPTLLAGDTRVTNHGYRDGKATPFQSTLEAGTAVLVDSQGVPRARCACGNPLDEPIQVVGEPQPLPPVTVRVPEPTPEPEPDEPTPVAAPGFCTVWAEVGPGISGGPGAAGLSIDAYLDAMVDAFLRLVAAAEATDGFPADALADLQAYLDDLEEAAAAASPGEGDTALRDRVQDFILEYCEDRPDTQVPDTAVEDEPDPVNEQTPTSANCGSFQFYLLVEAAEQLGLDHTAVSGLYLDGIAAAVAGADPGSEFDVGDLAPMLQIEEIGCQGATAMQQLFADNGMFHLIDGTELGP